MNPTRTLAAVLALALGTAASGGARAAEHHHHDAGGHEAQALQLDAGRQWATDAPLRRAMDDINTAMAKALPRIHHERFSDADYAALAATVEQKVAYAVAHCRLAPKADAMLHQVIAELLAGAGTMKGEDAAPRHDGAVRVVQALQSYARYFRHVGFKPAHG